MFCFSLSLIIISSVEMVVSENPGSRMKRADDPNPLQAVVESMSQRLNTLEAAVTTLQNKLNTYETTVAFHAMSGSPISTVAGGTIILPQVTTNIGGAYDPLGGFFTAPVSGLYQFHAKIMNADLNQQIHAGMYVGGTQVAITTSDSRHGYWDNPSLFAIVHVNKGQRVLLKNINGKLDHFYGDHYTSFSGFLIRAD